MKTGIDFVSSNETCDLMIRSHGEGYKFLKNMEIFVKEAWNIFSNIPYIGVACKCGLNDIDDFVSFALSHVKDEEEGYIFEIKVFNGKWTDVISHIEALVRRCFFEKAEAEKENKKFFSPEAWEGLLCVNEFLAIVKYSVCNKKIN